MASSANGEHVDTTHDVRSGTAVLETVQHCIGATPHPRRLCAKRTAQKRERARRATAAETKHLPPAHTIHRAWPLLTGPRDNTARLTTPHLNRTTPPPLLLLSPHCCAPTPLTPNLQDRARRRPSRMTELHSYERAHATEVLGTRTARSRWGGDAAAGGGGARQQGSRRHSRWRVAGQRNGPTPVAVS